MSEIVGTYSDSEPVDVDMRGKGEVLGDSEMNRIQTKMVGASLVTRDGHNGICPSPEGGVCLVAYLTIVPNPGSVGQDHGQLEV